MSKEAAELLDQAWDLYYKVASVPDGSIISQQSPSWVLPWTPYDFAAGLCKSLIPLTYNFNGRLYPDITQEIWDMMINSGQVNDIEFVNEILNRMDA